MKTNNKQLEMLIDIVFANNGDYCFQAQVLKDMYPNGW